MKRLFRIALLLSLPLAACGQQLVDFPNNPPTVISTSPADTATGVGFATQVSATFSGAMNASTLTAATFTVSQGANPIAGTVLTVGATATFSPAVNLTANTTYDATIKAGVKDTAGNALVADYDWSFTTSPNAGDTTAPVVASTVPANLATGVSVSSDMSATFNNTMNASTLTPATFTLSQGTTSIAGTVVTVGGTATFSPTDALAANTTYDATIKAGVKDTAGNALAADYDWSFTTSQAVNTTPPLVTSTDPQNLAIDVPVTQAITVTFSEDMNQTTINSTTLLVKQGTVAVPGLVTYADVNAVATFTPTANLTPNTTYTCTVTTGVKDVAGNALVSNDVWTFQTSAGPPAVVSTNPTNETADLCIPFEINATFNQDMDPLTLTATNFLLTGPGTAPIEGSVSYDALSMTASFQPASALPGNATYTATLTTGVKNAAEDALANNYVWTFSTSSTPCVVPVNLRSLTTFVAVAGSGLTNSNSGGITVLNGDVGLSPTGTCLGDGSPCSALDPTINGTLYINDPAGKAAAAKADLVSAFNDAMGRPPGTVEADLAGMILAPGVYTSGSTMTVAVGGTVTLDGQGDQNAVWIFQVGSSLTVNNNVQVLLINGAKAANVFWAAGASSTLGSDVSFQGTVLAQASNSVGVDSTVDGRLLCTDGEITLLADTINLP